VTTTDLHAIAPPRHAPIHAPHLTRYRLSLHGVTAEVVAPHRPFARLLQVALGGYPASPVDIVPDFRISLEPAEGVDRWRVSSTAHPRPRVIRSAVEAARHAEWMFADEGVRRLSRYVHVHGAVFAAADRSGILVGRSGMGKSTTSVGLACAGLTLFADDVTLIDPETLRPVSFCRPIKLDESSRSMLRSMGLNVPARCRLRESVARYAIPGMPASDAPVPPVEVVLFFAAEREASPHLRPLTLAEAMLRFVRQSVSESVDSNGSTAGVLAIVNAARCYELTAGRLEDTVRIIADLMRDRTVSEVTP